MIGSRLHGSEVIVLRSDLGGGKTAFVRGLSRGIGSSDHVSSPTFTISREYISPVSNLTLYHFDFYRLSEPGLMTLELSEIIHDPRGVVAIEWGDIVEGVVPIDSIQVDIESTGDTEREFMFKYPINRSYIFEGLSL